jgi:hypothetical protein
MEEYKDVMLSEPPGRFQQSTAQSGAGMHAVSLENYKGILLCDRPANILAGGNRGSGEGGVAPFLPSGKVEDKVLGLQPTQEQRAKMEMCRSMRATNNASKDLGKASNPALSKHRRWLRSFAQAVREMKLSQAEQFQKMEETKERVQKAQAEARQKKLAAAAAAPAFLEEQPQAVVSSSCGAGGGAAEKQPSPKPPTTTTTVVSDGKSKPKGKKGGKPKWAMTEDEALDAELTEHLGLVKFAKELDFSSFIQDYEVQEALAIMRDRVTELAKEHGIDLATAKESALNANTGDDDDDWENLSVAPSDASMATKEAYAQRLAAKKAKKVAADTAALLSAAAGAGSSSAQHTNEWNKTTNVGEAIRIIISSDALSLADKILATSESMRRIHTRNSLARLLQNVCLGGTSSSQQQQQLQATAVLDGSCGVAVPPPVQAAVAAEATGLQKDGAGDKRILTKMRLAKDKTQNLPYLYRCPSL